jgi:pimeloyl-ACP methyl ester carboxylesterase
MGEITHRTVHSNGVDLHVAEAGSGPPVILCHGFPESWYSWRHQLPALAAAGYRAIAPDQRGYGDSDLPTEVSDYGIRHLTADLLGLLDDIGEEKAIFVGHDWGALIVWDLATLHPDRVEAVVGVSVPFFRAPMKPTDVFEALSGGNFFYILYFQDVGPAERELEADPRATMAKVLYGVSGDAIGDGATLPSALPREGTGFLTQLADPPEDLPAWLTESDVDEYARQFTRSGFFGPVSYYRNLDANWELTHELPAPAMPSYFIGGAKDPVIAGNPVAVPVMESLLPGFRGATMIPGAGHWTQQERPEEFNQALLGFLSGL